MTTKSQSGWTITHYFYDWNRDEYGNKPYDKGSQENVLKKVTLLSIMLTALNLVDILQSMEWHLELWIVAETWKLLIFGKVIQTDVIAV